LFVPSTVRLSIWRVTHRLRNLRKHSRKRPVLRVGLPNAIQITSVLASVPAPSATSHTLSAMAEPSSITIRMRLPSLCRPAKASVLFSLQGVASARQLFSASGSAL
jgi:hypothetical protein